MADPQTPNNNGLLKYKNVVSEKKATPYLIAYGRGYSVTIIETPNGFFLRLKQGDQRINLQLDLLKLLEATSRIRERLSRIVKA